MTIKAARLIAEVDVIAYPAANDGPSLARTIAAPYIPDQTQEITYSLPMSADRGPAQDAYDRLAEDLEQHLLQGSTIGVLCEGDPLFYGSFMYLAARLSSRFDTDIIPGVTSVSAAAAATLHPLVARTETLAILPATLPSDDLTAALGASQSAAVLKLGRHVAKVKSAAQALGADALYVERATHLDQRILPLSSAPDPAPYFSLALIRRARDPWLT